MSKKLLVLVAILLLSSWAMAQGTGAMLFATGRVDVNGTGVNRSYTVMEGDVIETAADGTVTLAGSGTSVLVQGNSLVMYSKSGINLGTGGISVKTTEGMSSHIGNITVQPQAASARYRVTQNGSSVQVDALEGSVTLSDGAKNAALSAGHSQTLTCSSCGSMTSQILAARDKNMKQLQDQQAAAMANVAPVHPPAAVTVGAGTTSASSGTAAAGAGAGSAAAAGGGNMGMIFTMVAVGAGAGIGAAVAVNQKASSPSGP